MLKICKNKLISFEMFADNSKEMEKQAYEIKFKFIIVLDWHSLL